MGDFETVVLQAKCAYSDFSDLEFLGVDRKLHWISNVALSPEDAAAVMKLVCNGDDFEGIRHLDPSYRVFLARVGSPAMYLQTDKCLTDDEEDALKDILAADEVNYREKPCWVGLPDMDYMDIHSEEFVKNNTKYQILAHLPGSGYRVWWD